MFKNIADIRKAAANKETSSVPLWFAPSTMEFFNTRVMDEVFNMGEFGSLFITADRPDLDTEEGFAIRWAHMKDGLFHITTLGDIMAYGSLGEAWNAADGISDALPDIVRFTR
jgi:hypothetical protein